MNMFSKIKYMKIFIPKINESWIVDRFRSEWYENNRDTTTKSIHNADVIWIMAPWMWKKIPKFFLKRKRFCAPTTILLTLNSVNQILMT